MVDWRGREELDLPWPGREPRQHMPQSEYSPRTTAASPPELCREKEYI